MSSPTLLRAPVGRDDAVYRSDVRFSADGGYAGCLAGQDDGGTFLELWSLTATGPRCVLRAPVDSDPAATLIQPCGNGRGLVAVRRAGAHRLGVLDHDGALHELGGHSLEDLRVTAAPACTGALALGVHGDTVYRIDEHARLTPLAVLPGTPVGNAVPAGERLLLGVRDGERTATVAIDLPTGTVSHLEVDTDRPWRALAAGGAHVLAAVGTTGGGRLGLVHDGELRLLPRIDLGGTLTPFALHPDGDLAAVVVSRGARCWLALVDTATGRSRGVVLPAGVVGAAGGWTGHGLWCTTSSTGRPAAFCWLPPDALRLGSFTPTARVTGRRSDPERWTRGRVESFRGPEGPIETVVTGADWRGSARVVVALPRRRWTLGFDRQFQALAEAGVTVVAANTEDELAVAAIGRVIAVARAERGRSLPALYGTGRGADLAVRCADAEPQTWSRCVAVGSQYPAQETYAGVVHLRLPQRGDRDQQTRAHGADPVLAAVTGFLAPGEDAARVALYLCGRALPAWEGTPRFGQCWAAKWPCTALAKA